jgi:purine-nucleoside phosphorylase
MQLIMTQTSTDLYDRAAAAIRQRVDRPVRAAIILGSGLSSLADVIDDAQSIPYHNVPGFAPPTVPGHSGQLVCGTLEGVPVIAQQGRLHFYEGYTPEQVAFPVRVMRRLGAEMLIVTNAAGGINRAFAAGDIMLITDHINFVGLAGHNPLIGRNDESFGARFVSMTQAYDRDLADRARRAAQSAGIQLREGVYAGVAGPFFESPAEIRMLRTLGADAVGMSTVHEVVAAVHAGMRVLAFSAVTNISIDSLDADQAPSHEEVLELGRAINPRLSALIRGVLRGL